MYILDTNVLSELRRGSKADPRVSTWIDNTEPATLYLSAMTVHELEVGVLLMERRDPVQGRFLRAWMTDNVMAVFVSRILALDTAVMLQSARFHAPNPHPLRDGLIAATALVHDMTVVTRNVDDFARTGVRLLNPWES